MNLTWRTAAQFLFLALITSTADAQNQQPDDVTRQLFRQYLTGGKVDSESIRAATHLVADRGRRNGFWKDVLQELQTTERQSAEIHCVTVLGKMLGYDASARRSIQHTRETGELPQQIPSMHLGPEVVTELLQRGRLADRHMMDHYVIALARAQAPEAKEFFQSLLQAGVIGEGELGVVDRQPRQTMSAAFHAAVGLAQLGDIEGINWLVNRSDRIHVNAGDVEHSIPGGVERRQRRIGICCLAALQQLSDNRNLTTKAEWTEWAKTVDRKSLTKQGVYWDDF